ncbi:zf-HC2 domain-containing protein [candidate division KSB1 bacterium]|nr:zf-HC2 domain-containing protein [candidate division KSB1 bacterium]
MNCIMCLEKLIDYLDGDITDALKEEIDLHLGHCDACRREFDIQLIMRNQVSRLPSLKCPDRVTRDVLERIEHRTANSSTRIAEFFDWLTNRYKVTSWKLKYATIAVAFALFSLMMYNVYHHEQNVQGMYTELEIEKAKQDIHLALAYIHRYSSKTENLLKERVPAGKLLKPLEQSLDITIKTMLNGGQNEKDFSL